MTDRARPTTRDTRRPPRLPGFLLGIGLGGFIDGIVLHQIFQWHHMVSHTESNPTDTIAGLEANTLADGLFHLATWIFVAVGMVLAVRAWQRRELAPPWRSQIGLLLAGWGAFNVVEGLVNHQILGIHHVRDDLGAPLGWDLGFLAFGVALVVVGVLLVRAGERMIRDRVRDDRVDHDRSARGPADPTAPAGVGSSPR
jgi:uncharacterized membrane protein